MKKYVILILIQILINLNLFTQRSIKITNNTTQNYLITFPNTRNSNTIVDFVKKNFSDDEERAGAFFYWITQTFAYDVQNMNKVFFYENEQQIINEILKSGSGVCIHFALLYNRVCNLAGIKTFVIEGYTKQNGKLDILPHAWNATFIKGKWELIDPTWGSGQIADGQFTKKLNSFYFMIKPDEFIKSHCPFEPMWQLLPYPVSYNSFDRGIYKTDKNNPTFSFNDSIIAFEKRDSLSQYFVLLNKLKNVESPNFHIIRRTEQIQTMINQYRKNYSISLLQKSVEFLNISVLNLNEFIDYFNHQFSPPKKDNLLNYMLFNIENPLDSCKRIISSINYIDPNIKYNIGELQKKIDEVNLSLGGYKEFTKRYISRPKFFRNRLFYNSILTKSGKKSDNE